METTTNKPTRDELRSRIGLLTIDESARIVGTLPLKLSRLVTLGVLGFNADANGRLLIQESDLRLFMGRGCPGLDDMPPIRSDGFWFQPLPVVVDARTFKSALTNAGVRGQSELREIDSVSLFGSKTRKTIWKPSGDASSVYSRVAIAETGVSFGLCLCVSELRSHVLYRLNNGDKPTADPTRETGRPVERLFGLGPDRFGALRRAAEKRLANMTFAMGDEKRPISLRDVAGGNQLAADIRTASKIAF